jgi:hypothetical protein
MRHFRAGGRALYNPSRWVQEGIRTISLPEQETDTVLRMRLRELGALALTLGAFAELAPIGARAGTPAPVDSRNAVAQAVIDCRKITDDVMRLACYDKAASAFDQAQAKGDVVVVSREHVQQVRRQAFGFHMPSLDIFGGGPKKGEGIDRLTLVIENVQKDRDGDWVLQGADGAVWRQTDQQEFFKDPARGAAMLITPAALGSYFCKIAGLAEFRCARVR